MSKFFFFLCLFICVQDEPVITWSESSKLSWTDFRDEPQNLGDAVATTASGITFGFSIKESNTKGIVAFTANVDAHFYPEKSWYKPEQATLHVLGHEQLHFDITELHARKFRKRIHQLSVNQNIKSQLRALHKEILIELAQMQDKYDAETNFSRHFENQKKWEHFIAEELQRLSNFKRGSHLNE